jgi:hypothetical protein
VRGFKQEQDDEIEEEEEEEEEQQQQQHLQPSVRVGCRQRGEARAVGLQRYTILRVLGSVVECKTIPA